MTRSSKKSPNKKSSDQVLKQIDKIVPGFRGFFKTAEKSKTFGPRLKEIRKEIERRFGKVKK